MRITPEIEAVARAIYDSDEVRLPWETITHDDRYFTFAIAAIRALRVPTESQMSVGSDVCQEYLCCGYVDAAEGCYTAMIDAALGENK